MNLFFLGSIIFFAFVVIVAVKKFKENSIEQKTRSLQAKRAALDAREERLNIRQAQLLEEQKRLMLEKRRFKAFEKIMVLETAKLEACSAELKVFYNGNVPKEKLGELADNFFDGLKKEDGGFFRSLFGNPFALTSEPKPIKILKNNVDKLLMQQVQEKAINENELEEMKCPISYQVMQDPAKGEDGRTYERVCLENIYIFPGTYPFDRREMKVDPCDLPRDQAICDKIQTLIKKCEQETHLIAKADGSNHAHTTGCGK